MKNIVVLILPLLLFTAIFAGATDVPEFKDQFQQPLDQWINAEIDSDTMMVKMNQLERIVNTQERDWERMYWESRIALMRGQIYYERGEKKMSLQLLDESRQFSEESIAAHETSDAWRIMSEAGSLYMLQKGIFYIMQNSALTVEQARKALELDPENARASLIVAQFQYNAPPIAGGDKEEGISILETLRSRPDLSREDWFFVYLTLSEVLYKEKRTEEAIVICRRALILYPGNVAAAELLTEMSEGK